jgi:hypothetical protein
VGSWALPLGMRDAVVCIKSRANGVGQSVIESLPPAELVPRACVRVWRLCFAVLKPDLNHKHLIVPPTSHHSHPTSWCVSSCGPAALTPGTFPLRRDPS